jgi:hypothetical protein
MRGLKYFEFSSKLKKDHGEEVGRSRVKEDGGVIDVEAEEVSEKKKKGPPKKPRKAEKPPKRGSSGKKDK